MKKKILCYVIFISLIFSYCPLVFAEDNIEEVTTNEDNNIIIEQQEQVIDQPVKEVKVEEVEEIVEEDAVVEREEQTPNADGSVTVHYTNILSSLASHREDGVPVPYETSVKLSATQTKNQAHKGTYSYFGGADYSFGYMGVQYTFLNAVVETEKDKNSPVFENTAPYDTITKVKNNHSDITYTYKNGDTELVESRSDIYLSPVYKQEQSWKLNYNYIDNISTGSGSWSNLDAITQYKHTFSNPETKSPTLTDGLYKFQYWENEETGVQYGDGDEFVYSSPELRNLEKTVNVYAYWQPVVKVNLYNGSELIQSLSSFEAVSSSDFTTIASTDIQEFIGWRDENGSVAADMYNAPSITREAGYLIVNLFANFKEIIQPTPDTPEDPTPDTPKPQPKNTTAQVVVSQEDMVVADSNPPTIITPAAVPQAAPSGYWALINLILTIIAGIIAIVSVGKKKEKPDGEPYSEEDKHDIRNLFKYKLFSLLVALGAIVVFILTEDITLPMGYVDNWTLVMVLFPVVEIFNVYFINKIANYDNHKEN